MITRQAQTAEMSKQMLQEMLERKRRNDYVRRREFDYLRKLRSKKLGTVHSGATKVSAISTGGEDSSARGAPVSSADGISSGLRYDDERAITLKKIDEIEAQMSMQWWKGRGATRPAALPSLGEEPLCSLHLSEASASETPTTPSAEIFSRAGAQRLAKKDGEESTPSALENVAAEAAETHPMTLPAAFAAVPHSLLHEAFVHEPSLEEAAVAYAHGRFDNAEESLLKVVASSTSEGGLEEAWLTLFDFYRSTGRESQYRVKALEFARFFGKSAPAWFSLPELLGLPEKEVVLNTAPGAPPSLPQALYWRAPSILKIASLQALDEEMGKTTSPITLGWSDLTAIEPDSVTALTQWVSRLSGKRIRIHLEGEGTLLDLLSAHTPLGDPAVNQEWWFLRLEVLRMLGFAEEFDAVALDYCVTYEVSPPSWEAPLCECCEASEVAPEFPSILSSAASLAGPLGKVTGKPKAAVLSGVVLGTADDILAKYQPLICPGYLLVVQCNHLVRMDFPAAGSVLNWAAAQHAANVPVQFKNLHRLVAILFNVLGINRHATISIRQN